MTPEQLDERFGRIERAISRLSGWAWGKSNAITFPDAPPKIDPDLIEARKVAAEYVGTKREGYFAFSSGDVLAGRADDKGVMLVVAAIKRGRDLAEADRLKDFRENVK